MGNDAKTNGKRVLRLDPSTLATIERAALSGYPEEACGLMLGEFLAGGSIRVSRAIQLPNHAASAEKTRRYEIDSRLILHWDRVANQAGESIVGFFHSHPDHSPRPSATDAQLAWPAYAYLIASVTGSKTSGAINSGFAAWTFEDASTSFREMTIEVDIEPDQIEYYI